MPGEITETPRERSRRNLKPPWRPGVSPNPGGRPKTKPISDAFRKLLSLEHKELKTFKPSTVAELVALAQVTAATMPTEKGTAPLREIADRVEGRAAAAQEDRDAVANAITADRLADLLDLAASRLKGK